MSKLTHIDDQGRARMVDVGDKASTRRRAEARCLLRCAPDTLNAVRSGTTPKGNVITTAELAGVMAAKRTADLIPLCHPLALSHVSVTIALDDAVPGFAVHAEVSTTGQTGVEMEALTAVTVAALTLFDMLKAIDKAMVIDGVRVTAKSGGRSGDWTQP